VSTGLEPYFSFSYFRSGRLGKFIEVNAKIVEDWLELNPGYTKQTLPDYFVSAMELTPEEHADTQCAIQRWIDSSISKTVNAPRGFSVRQVQKIYERLYDGGAKGGTVYVDGSRDSQVLSLSNDDESNWAQMDIVHDFGISVKEKQVEEKKTDLRSDRQDRNIGVEVGDICPICLEGTVEEIGGCNTCTNCNAQLKCGL
ncbi:MAG TPA: ribonucleoside-diphosphate reductase, partial [Erysipelotrichaceae bacterium]|nr:ribonucleoside-diphosphate reductase [Erysipelotrichaceae bacterium]